MNHHRRQVLKLGLAGLVSTLPACASRNGAGAGPSDEPLLGFKAVPVSTADAIAVPPGYRAQVLYAWGDAVGAAAGQPAFKWDASNSAAEQELQDPRSCEITGVTMSPDGRSLFINIQHPGETASERNDPAAPRAVSNWPDFRPNGRPRAATVVVQRSDGGLIGI